MVIAAVFSPTAFWLLIGFFVYMLLGTWIRQNGWDQMPPKVEPKPKKDDKPEDLYFKKLPGNRLHCSTNACVFNDNGECKKINPILKFQDQSREKVDCYSFVCQPSLSKPILELDAIQYEEYKQIKYTRMRREIPEDKVDNETLMQTITQLAEFEKRQGLIKIREHNGHTGN